MGLKSTWESREIRGQDTAVREVLDSPNMVMRLMEPGDSSTAQPLVKLLLGQLHMIVVEDLGIEALNLA